MRVILITGASSGFGMDTAKQLLSTGEWTVYAAARRTERLKELEDLGAHLLTMDVTKEEEVRDGVQQIIEEQGKIDTLLANAGYGSFGTVECVPEEEAEYQFQVNVFGVGRLIRAVLPYMREKRSGRIIITASLVAHVSMLGMGWYAASKHAVRALSVALRQEVKALGIDVVLIEPGVVKTSFDGVALEALRKLNHADDYKKLVHDFDNYIQHAYANCPDAKSTVRGILAAITKKRPKLVYKTTFDSKLLSRLVHLLPQQWLDAMIRWQMFY